MALCVNLSLSSTSGTQFHVSLRQTTTRSILFVVLCEDVVNGNKGVDSLLRDEVPAKEPRYDSMKNCGLKSKSLCVVNAQRQTLKKVSSEKVFNVVEKINRFDELANRVMCGMRDYQT